MVLINICMKGDKRGPGVWKINDTVLNNERLCDEVRTILTSTAAIYSYMSKKERWEMMKTQAIKHIKAFSKEEREKDKLYHFNLYKILSDMQQELLINTTTVNEEFDRNMDRVKADIDSYAEHDAKRAAFRCRAKWSADGERSSSYFFSLEKRNYITKTVYALRRNDGTLTKDYEEILGIQHEFYEKLYTSDTSVRFTLVNHTGIRLNESQKLAMDQDVTKDELFDAMMTLKLNKTPGCDGLSLTFYRKFWNEIAEALHEMYMESLQDGELNTSGRRGIINLIPKKGRDGTWVKNWRPISLLTYDFKIWAKCMANRMETVAHEMIGKQQTGFMKGRSIHSNLLTTIEVASYLAKHKQPGVIALVDFEKCFDRIEHKSIQGTFEYFGFGGKFISMLFLLYSNIELCTQNNGFISPFLWKKRGVNQGCPASPLVYTFCGECLAHLIQQNSSIKGISMYGLESLLSQFADDTGAFLSYDRDSLEAFGNALYTIERNLGLKVSYEKTTLYRVGSLRNTEAKVYTTKPFAWSNDPLVSLGLTINTDGSLPDCNAMEILQKVRSTCNTWYNRQLSLMGKILVINTLLGSLFVYKLMAMMSLTQEQIKEFEGVVHQFLWKGKRARISMDTLKKDKKQGGLRLVDIGKKLKALRISWIFKLDENSTLSKNAYSQLSPKLGNLIWRCNLNGKDVRKLFEHSVWRDILEAWSEINFNDPHSGEIADQVIWMNSHIRRGNYPFLLPTWLEKDIFLVKDLFNHDGSYKSLSQLNLPESEWMNYNSVKQSLPLSWCMEPSECADKPTSLYGKMLTCANTSRFAYNLLIEDGWAVLKYLRRWQESGLDLEYIEFEDAFNRLFLITKLTKFRDFQYRMLLGKLVTNADLYAWGTTECDRCTFCNNQSESLEHILWQCEYVREIRQLIVELCELCDCNIPRWKDVLLNGVHEKDAHILNFVLVVAKQYVYRCKCLNVLPNIYQYKKELRYLYDIDLFNARKMYRAHIVESKWNPIIELFNT